MTNDPDTAAPRTAAHPAVVEQDRPPRGVLPALCLTSITSWGILYYAFPVLLPAITADTGWSASACNAAFSAALLVSAGVGIPVGRLIDRRGPRAVMTWGSVLGTVALLGLAAAPNPAVFAVAWLAVGVAMAGTLYQPAFAAVARWWGPRRVRALTAVTLTGGLASTVFAPLTAALAEPLGWRGAYLVLAAVFAVVTVPPHFLALRAPWPAQPEPGPAGAAGTGVARSRPFVLLATALTLSGFVVFGVVIALVPLLTERGLSPSTAAWALGLGGAGQTLGRALYATLARRTGTVARTVTLIALGGATTAALGLVPGPAWLLVVLSVLAGMVRGNVTLLQATAVPDRWGSAAYGRLSALLAAPVTVVGALTPFATAALAGPLGGYPRLFAWLAVLSAVAAALAVATGVRGAPTR
ncbi:MFS transporter [Streptomyces sp. NPDC127098]|uniref:MFS transporter n=1 Tax=Streptomyces sp. NPDC127098 TaxID=3347137 RepID=UPI00365F5C17